MKHEDIVEAIKMSGNEMVFRVIDERSDDIKMKNKPFLFRIVKGKGGYGFYLWQDTDGHYVEDITVNSPADRAGLRAGDRIIEINSVNIEAEGHEDVFYRIKACHNVSSSTLNFKLNLTEKIFRWLIFLRWTLKLLHTIRKITYL